MDDILIVDGYNVIGAWHNLSSLRRKDFENARDLLIDKLSEYQAQTGWRIILIFDAYLKPGKETTTRKANVDVIYTKKNEKADQKIEGLISKLKNVKTRIHVATSDMAEQWAVFSQGALRIPSRELINELEKMDQHLEEKTQRKQTFKGGKIPMDEATRKKLEKMRRGF
ncbi:NYN domain-containing protein [Sporolactobacillus spathodeae]|uniref:RNA-binding protein with PIN domain n=1 Tax=Sporolactobacillus spathodeae TaxID=1465502 RepID=A0ABS2Q9T8_9BACL|nr:NYN domain-containing protein [Sporolactobacillus spathodeae]MBM7658551.1 putative RNA-binding protein with PIN domain [Sporolactobacillus spathodeae]